MYQGIPEHIPPTDFQRSRIEIEEYCVPKDAQIPGH